MKNLTVGFIGFGLIGGSIAKNLRSLYPDFRLIAYNYNPKNTNPNLLLAKEEHTLDTIVSSFDEEFSKCDIIFLCAPVLRNISYLSELKRVMKTDCILTDVGSVKGNIHQAIKELEMDNYFIGGHPMAGSEKTGYDHSSIQLLNGTIYILTPTEQTPKKSIDIMKKLVSSMGAIPIILNSTEHDDFTAAISHVPHIIAASLVNMVQDYDDDQEHMRLLAAGGFKDITRIASSSPVMWENVCQTNPDSIIKFLDIFSEYINQMKEAIQTKNSVFLNDYFSRSKKYRDSIPNKPIDTIKRINKIYLEVPENKVDKSTSTP